MSNLIFLKFSIFYILGPCADGEQFRAHPKNPGPACIYWGETTDSVSRY